MNRCFAGMLTVKEADLKAPFSRAQRRRLGTSSMKELAVGKYDSSITRVRPFFSTLIHARKPWLAKLLGQAKQSKSLAAKLAKKAGDLLPDYLRKRRFNDPVLKHYGIGEIELELCFETPLPPTKPFLRWLITHPDQLTWPDDDKRRFSKTTQKHRKDLVGDNGARTQQRARREALELLLHYGACRSRHKWWAFEDFAYGDCYIETEELVVLFQGRRAAPLAPATDWFPQRSQLVAHLEIAQEIGKTIDKEYAVMVLAENDIGPVYEEVFEAGLPHFTPAERRDLMGHYLGCVRWKDACKATGVSYSGLPSTTSNWVSECGAVERCDS